MVALQADPTTAVSAGSSDRCISRELIILFRIGPFGEGLWLQRR